MKYQLSKPLKLTSSQWSVKICLVIQGKLCLIFSYKRKQQIIYLIVKLKNMNSFTANTYIYILHLLQE